MDRRKFLKTGAAVVAAASFFPLGATENVHSAPKTDGFPDVCPDAEKLKIRFLGTGAADWKGPDRRGEHRRLTSILVNGEFLIDYTETDFDMLPAGCRPRAIFYTHSHGDHYDPEAALKLGIRRVYLEKSWEMRAKSDFRKASGQTGIPEPEITAIYPGARVKESGLVITALPANHATGHLNELALIYLIESRDARVLYATDTGGLPGVSTRLASIDGHKEGTPITGLIMEATMGIGHEDDFRIFTHSSVDMVARTVRVLSSTGRYTPKEGQSVWLTHLARTLHGTQAELDKELPQPLKAAYDGLEISF